MHTPNRNRGHAPRWHAQRWQRWVDAAPDPYEHETRQLQRYAAFLRLRNDPTAPAAPPIYQNRYTDHGPKRGLNYN